VVENDAATEAFWENFMVSQNLLCQQEVEQRRQEVAKNEKKLEDAATQEKEYQEARNLVLEKDRGTSWIPLLNNNQPAPPDILEKIEEEEALAEAQRKERIRRMNNENRGTYAWCLDYVDRRNPKEQEMRDLNALIQRVGKDPGNYFLNLQYLVQATEKELADVEYDIDRHSLRTWHADSRLISLVIFLLILHIFIKKQNKHFQKIFIHN